MHERRLASSFPVAATKTSASPIFASKRVLISVPLPQITSASNSLAALPHNSESFSIKLHPAPLPLKK